MCANECELGRLLANTNHFAVMYGGYSADVSCVEYGQLTFTAFVQWMNV